YICFFFFQAEGGIRGLIVTGVQTCALPIFDDVRIVGNLGQDLDVAAKLGAGWWADDVDLGRLNVDDDRDLCIADAEPDVSRDERSEERRVGKERRSECSTSQRQRSIAAVGG